MKREGYPGVFLEWDPPMEKASTPPLGWKTGPVRAVGLTKTIAERGEKERKLLQGSWVTHHESHRDEKARIEVRPVKPGEESRQEKREEKRNIRGKNADQIEERTRGLQ